MRPDPTELIERAAALAAPGRRRLLGICGSPAAGKSTLAETIVAALGDAAVCVPMDGFHLAQVELDRLGRADRKGAPDTFDGAGYVALLRRLRTPVRDEVVYAPAFRREIEEPVAGAVPVAPHVPLVITEGNYLLVDTAPWDQVAGLLDEVWFLRVPARLRRDRLIARHREFGRSAEQARERALGSDERNAELIESTAHRAHLIVQD